MSDVIHIGIGGGGSMRASPGMVANTRPPPASSSSAPFIGTFSARQPESNRLVSTNGIVYVEAYKQEMHVMDVMNPDSLRDLSGKLMSIGMDEDAERVAAIEQVGADLYKTLKERENKLERQYEINMALGSANIFWRVLAVINIAVVCTLVFIGV